MRRVEFHPAAAAEIEDAAAYYESRRRGLGAALRRELAEALRTIKRSPGRAARFEETALRFVALSRFPYVLFYETLGDHVAILAFAHGRRRPLYWADRSTRDD